VSKRYGGAKNVLLGGINHLMPYQWMSWKGSYRGGKESLQDPAKYIIGMKCCITIKEGKKRGMRELSSRRSKTNLEVPKASSKNTEAKIWGGGGQSNKRRLRGLGGWDSCWARQSVPTSECSTLRVIEKDRSIINRVRGRPGSPF